MSEESEITDDKPIDFFAEHPPIQWKDQTGADKLMGQCTRTALAWRRKTINAKTF